MDCDQGQPQRRTETVGRVVTTGGVCLNVRKYGRIAGSDVVRDDRNAGSTAQPAVVSQFEIKLVLTTPSRATSGRYIFVQKQED
jgi:hypothetical protein